MSLRLLRRTMTRSHPKWLPKCLPRVGFWKSCSAPRIRRTLPASIIFPSCNQWRRNSSRTRQTPHWRDFGNHRVGGRFRPIARENEDSGKVTMMTLHTAKGLEYPYVFLTGMEQGTFPHQRAMEDTSELAEERRLAYVGITRAKRRLYVTRAAVRAQWGQASDMMPSQFLDEIPDELIDWKDAKPAPNACVPAGRMTTTSSAAGTMMTISDRCHSAVPRMESRIMVPHTVPARGGLVPHTDRLHMGQGARSTAARLRRAHHPRMVPHPGARAEDREPVPHTARMVRMAPASQEGNRARSSRDVSSRKTSLWI